MVCMTRARHGRRSTRIPVRNSNPAKGEESDNSSKGHVTPLTDDEAPPICKNTGGMSSPIYSGTLMMMFYWPLKVSGVTFDLIQA